MYFERSSSSRLATRLYIYHLKITGDLGTEWDKREKAFTGAESLLQRKVHFIYGICFILLKSCVYMSCKGGGGHDWPCRRYLLYYVMKVALPAVSTPGRQVAAEQHFLGRCVCKWLQRILYIPVGRSKNLNATFFCRWLIFFLYLITALRRLASIPAITELWIHPETAPQDTCTDIFTPSLFSAQRKPLTRSEHIDYMERPWEHHVLWL